MQSPEPLDRDARLPCVAVALEPNTQSEMSKGHGRDAKDCDRTYFKPHQKQQQQQQQHLSRTRLLLVAQLIHTAAAWSNGAALKPPMGWANWNNFGCNYSEALLHEMADAFVSSGLAGAGRPWDGAHMLVQECIVPKGARDPTTNVVQPDAAMFPNGLANLSAYFHDRGLRAGACVRSRVPTTDFQSAGFLAN